MSEKNCFGQWQPIETAPKDGFMLVHEDGAIRLKLRINGAWHGTALPALVSRAWGDAVVGADVERVAPGFYLADRDGCCLSPTEWMPAPDLPAIRSATVPGEAA